MKRKYQHEDHPYNFAGKKVCNVMLHAYGRCGFCVADDKFAKIALERGPLIGDRVKVIGTTNKSR
jgi:hypothetical protein